MKSLKTPVSFVCGHTGRTVVLGEWYLDDEGREVPVFNIPENEDLTNLMNLWVQVSGHSVLKELPVVAYWANKIWNTLRIIDKPPFIEDALHRLREIYRIAGKH